MNTAQQIMTNNNELIIVKSEKISPLSEVEVSLYARLIFRHAKTFRQIERKGKLHWYPQREEFEQPIHAVRRSKNRTQSVDLKVLELSAGPGSWGESLLEYEEPQPVQ